MPAALKDTQVSVRLPNELKDRMEAYAELTGRTKSHVAMEALSSYLDWRTPQIEDLKAAIQGADQGDFATDDEVASVFAKYNGLETSTRTKAAAKPAVRPRRK